MGEEGVDLAEFWRCLGRVVGWVFLAFLGLAVVLAAIIFFKPFDERPEALPAALAQDTLPSIPDARNGFFYALGIQASEGSDPHAEGVKAWHALNEQLSKLKPWEWPAADLSTAPQVLKFELGEVACAIGSPCLPQLASKREALQRVLERHEALLKRCHTLARDFVFAELVPERSPFFSPYPLPHPIASCGALLRASAAFQYFLEDGNGAARALAANDRLARQVMAHAPHLLAKLVGTAQLRSGFALATEMAIAAPKAWPALQPLFGPLSSEELDVRPVLRGEYHSTTTTYAHFIRTTWASKSASPGFPRLDGADKQADLPWPVEKLVLFVGFTLFALSYEPQATINLHQRRMARVVEVAGGPPESVRQGMAEIRSEAETWLPRDGSLYNFAGRVVSGIGVGEFAMYVHRVIDAEAQRQLVLVALDVVDSKIPQIERAAFVTRWPANQYTKGRLRYDTERNAIVLTPWHEKEHRTEWLSVSLGAL